MKQMLMAGAATALTAAVATTQAFEQDASPDETTVPYVEYVAALDELQVASRAAFLRLGSAPAVAEVVAAYQEVIPLGKADLRRLTGVVPEPCYATAHQEVLAYRGSVIELIEQELPRMAESETGAELTATLEVLDAELHARHPSAYLDGPDASGGFGGSYRNILMSLAACDDDEIAQPADATSEPDQRVVVDGSYSVTIPGSWLHELEDPGSDGFEEDRLRRALGFAPNLWMSEPTGPGICQIEYGPSGGARLESVEADGRQHPEFDLDYVDLPAGRALRIVGPVEQGGVERQFVGYVMIERSIRVQIQCVAPVARDDGWLPIAESFQFLPEEAEDGAPDQPPSPSQGMSGRRLEVPEAGVAVHLPEEWVSLPTAMAGDDAVVAVFASPSGGGTCGIARYPSADGGPHEVGVEEFVSAGYWTGLPGGYATDRVGIAVGAVVKITFAEASVDTDAEYWNAIYVIAAERDLYTVQCTTDDPDGRPADDWLSIAETFEFLPDQTGESTSVKPEAGDGEGATADSLPDGRFGPDIGQGRIERPFDGFAITFPGDWDVEEVSASGNEWIDEHAENPQGAAVITQLVWAGDKSLNQQCFVSDASGYAASPPAWTELEQGVKHEAASMASWPHVEQHESSYLDLPAGRVGLVEFSYEDGSGGQMYIYKRGERWLTLHCEANVQSIDDWLAIAETLEFLPPEQG